MAILGIAWPFQKGTTEFPRQRTDDEVIEDNIRRILLTQKGERVMRPNEGSDVMKFVFENVGAVMRATLSDEVRRAVSNGEPRAQVERVQVLSAENKPARGRQIFVLLTYRFQGEIKKTQVRLA